MSSQLGIAVVGFGLIGQRHVQAIEACPDTFVAAIIEPGEAARAEATASGVPTFADLADFLERGSADGIILATPNRLHVSQGLDCLDRDMPVLIEKPIAVSTEEARRLVDRAESRSVPLLVGHHRRHNPLVARAKEAIDAGAIGQVRAVQSICWFYKPDAYFDAAEWRRRPGAGPVSVNLIHDVDLIRHFCGEVVRVQAQATPALRGYDNEDVAGALLTFENGAIGTITVSDSIVAPWSWEMTSHENPIYPPTPESCYLIGGSEGSLSLPDLKLWNHADGNRDWWRPLSAAKLDAPHSDPLTNQIANFASSIRGTEAPLVTGAEGLRSLQVIEAIQTSAESGESVRLN